MAARDVVVAGSCEVVAEALAILEILEPDIGDAVLSCPPTVGRLVSRPVVTDRPLSDTMGKDWPVDADTLVGIELS